jgi:hypothetical protein
MAYIAMVKQEIAYRGWLRYRKQQYSNQLIKHGLYILVKKAVVPKEFKLFKEDRT